jgi:hypothetical protein
VPASHLISLFSLAYFYVSGFFENIDDTFMFSAFSIVRRVGFSVCVCMYICIYVYMYMRNEFFSILSYLLLLHFLICVAMY